MAAKKKIAVRKTAKPERGKPATFAPESPSLPDAVASVEDEAGQGERKPTYAELVERQEAAALESAMKRAEAGLPLTNSDVKRLKKAAEAEEGKKDSGGGFDAARAADRLKIWWVNGDGEKYWMQTTDGEWKRLGVQRVTSRMVNGGLFPFAVGDEKISQVDQVFEHVENERTLSAALNGLAGWKKGVHTMFGERVLVTSEAALLKPKKGDWSMILELTRGLFQIGETAEELSAPGAEVQLAHLFAWLRRGILNYQEDGDIALPGRILAIAGDVGSGKSFYQHHVITPLLGGRAADPQAYLFGDSAFNEGWTRAPHLLMEDPRTASKMHDKVELARRLKCLSVNETMAGHAKGKSEITIAPKFRVSLSFNATPEAMRFFPPLSSDFTDKLLFIRAFKRPMPRVCETARERAAFLADLQMQLPAFAYYLLNEWKVPEGWDALRLGQPDYVHPEIRLMLCDDLPPAQFLILVDGTRIHERTNSGTNTYSIWGSEWGMSGEEALAQFRSGSAQYKMAERAIREGRKLWLGNFADLQELLTREGASYRGVAMNLTKIMGVPKMLGSIAADLEPDRFLNLGGREKRWLILEPMGDE